MKAYRENPDGEANQLATKQAEREIFALQRSAHMPPDEDDECGEHQSCGRCGGDGVIHLSEAGPSVWGEDCFCEEDRMIQCPTCRGEGLEHANT